MPDAHIATERDNCDFECGDYSCAAGTHTSSKPIRLPPDAAPGIYTLKVTLLAGGTTAAGTAIFEVQ